MHTALGCTATGSVLY